MFRNNIIGHEKNKKLLEREFENNNISHAYLFEGKSGLGKKEIAFDFAKSILSEGKDISINSLFNHPDFLLVVPDKGLIKKSIINEMISSIYLAPFKAKKRIIIIDDADTISVEGQNALLKTLEEPPHYMLLILISSKDEKLLPTILSRLQRVKFNPIDENLIKDYLIKNNVEKNKSNFLSRFVMGAIGDAIKLSSDEEFLEIRNNALDILEKLLQGDKMIAISSWDFFENKKQKINEILDLYKYYYRDILIVNKFKNQSLVVNQDKIKNIINFKNININSIEDSIECIARISTAISKNANYQLCVENMLIELYELSH